jgi:hypothetical protein
MLSPQLLSRDKKHGFSWRTTEQPDVRHADRDPVLRQMKQGHSNKLDQNRPVSPSSALPSQPVSLLASF